MRAPRKDFAVFLNQRQGGRVSVRIWIAFLQSLLVIALMVQPAQAAPIYFGNTAWQQPGACSGNMYTQYLCFPNDASPARTAAEQQIIAPYLARGVAPSDLLFVGNRQPTIDINIVITNWTYVATGTDNSRFANRTDRDLSAMVDGSLAHYGMDTNRMPQGTIVIAVFGDGTKAVFKLVVTSTSFFLQSTRRWEWTGQAWNAEGFEIDRTGNMRYPIIGPPTYEPGFGSEGGRRIGRSRPASGGTLIGSGRIEYWVQTVSVSGGGTSTRTFVQYVQF
jgi:hypothetical protein